MVVAVMTMFPPLPGAVVRGPSMMSGPPATTWRSPGRVPARSSAPRTSGSRRRTWSREASSGTTPP